VAAGLLLLAGCGDDGGDGSGDGNGGDGAPEAVGDTVTDAPEVEVEAFDFGYSPDPLVLTAGEPVNLVMRVTSGGHNLRIEGTGFQLPIVDEGDAVVAALTVAEPGDYRMVCTVPGHEAAGMVATLQVG
jgi:plastocyanin